MDAFNDCDADVLIQKVASKYARVFEGVGYAPAERRAVYRYLFSRRPTKMPPSLRSRILSLYDPLADRSSRFPDSLRWCINVYVGCHHACGYCYVNGYLREGVGDAPRRKADFREGLLRDLQDLEDFGVPPAPLHLSNSTDPLQEKLETVHGDCLFALKEIARHRSRFTSVTFLTKNPAALCDPRYLGLLSDHAMQPLTVQVSCAFWRDEIRSFFEPAAPPVAQRLEAAETLSSAGVAVDLRIDPLFPSSGVDPSVCRHAPMADYCLPEAQTREDLENLVRFARSAGIRAIVAKPLKVVVRGHGALEKQWFGKLYADSGGGQRNMRGGTWRLPEAYQRALLSELREIGEENGVAVRHCMHDVLARK